MYWQSFYEKKNISTHLCIGIMNECIEEDCVIRIYAGENWDFEKSISMLIVSIIVG